MIIPRYHIGPSKIAGAGKGLFLDEPVPRGRVIVAPDAIPRVHTMPEIERAFAPGGRMVYLGRTGEHAPVMLDVLVTQAARIAGRIGDALDSIPLMHITPKLLSRA